MTDPTPWQRPDSPFVTRLLTVTTSKSHAGIRADLARGGSPALAARALPHLARSITKPYEIDPALWFAAALASHPSIRQSSEVSLGQAAFRGLPRKDHATRESTDAGTRIVAVQRQQLKVAHRYLNALLTRVEQSRSPELDWHATWTTYRKWDHPDPQTRRNTRQRLLLDFFGATPAPRNSATSLNVNLENLAP